MILLGVLLLGVFPILGALAQDCEANPTGEDTTSLTISEPDQLRAFDNCTRILGGFSILNTFKGPFVLNSVTNITGFITLDSLVDTVDGIDALEMANLRWIMGLRLRRTAMLNRVQLPSLEEAAKDMEFELGPEGSWFDLQALKRVERLLIRGVRADATLPSLETVDWVLSIDSDPRSNANVSSTPVNIDLPVLKEAGTLNFYGQIRNLSLPNLAALNRDGSLTWGGLNVRADSVEFPGVFLPSLGEVNGELGFKGHIPRIELPGIEHTDASITINTNSEVAISSSLKDLGALYIRGQLTALNLSSLTNATTLDIHSDTKVACPINLISTHRRLYGTYEPPFCTDASLAAAGENPYTHYALPPSLQPTPSPEPEPFWSPTPTPTPRPDSSGGGGGLSEGARTAVIVVVVVLVACAVLGGFFIWRRKSSERQVGDLKGNVDASLGAMTAGMRHGSADSAAAGQERSSDHDAPPPYSREPPSAKG
ncbi:hypothetical protein BJY00DRAFT_315959 [Aspergillus carlsbadensis]|nr:hypothetical protein BJY00DRAFT_315959 [Aspergillus carlsbadensis]